MDAIELKNRLSRISTQWSIIFQAHQGQADAVSVAQQVLLQRYCGAIYRYLLGVLRDPDAADELSQEFSLRFVRGEFKQKASPRSRFRDYVRTALYELIIDYQNRKHRDSRAAAPETPEPAALSFGTHDPDRDFVRRWREELLAHAWEGLEDIQKRTGQPFHTVLRYRSENPQVTSAQMAEELGKRLGQPLTPESVRQTLHRAREKFGDLLLEEVGRSLQTREPQRLEQELTDLGLFAYCQTALKGPESRH